MMENLAKLPSEHCQTAKIKPSMAAEGMHFPTVAVKWWYNFHEFGGHLGNVV